MKIWHSVFWINYWSKTYQYFVILILVSRSFYGSSSKIKIIYYVIIYHRKWIRINIWPMRILYTAIFSKPIWVMSCTVKFLNLSWQLPLGFLMCSLILSIFEHVANLYYLKCIFADFRNSEFVYEKAKCTAYSSVTFTQTLNPIKFRLIISGTCE